MDWRELERRVDTIVDGRFSDPVVLLPWVRGTEVYLPGEEGPDPSRKMLITKGIIATPGAHLVGESGRATGGSGGGFNTQILEAEVWLSITTDNLGGNVKYWREYDRVYWPKTNEMFSISYLEPSATFRPNVHLIRAFDVVLGVGNPAAAAAVSPGVGSLYLDTDFYQFYRAQADDTWTKMA